jgi:hypothetical protein
MVMMLKPLFLENAIQLVRLYPSPPRPFDLRQLLHIVTHPATLGVVILGGCCVFSGIYIVSSATTSTFMAPLFLFIVVPLLFIVGSFFIASPFIYMWRWYRALKWGKLAYAVVIELEVAPSGNRSSYDALTNGAARGSWQIDFPGKRITETFYTDAPWATTLYIGAYVQVLVHPSKPIVWMPLGR